MQILIVDDEQDVQPLFEQRFRREIRTRKLALAFAFSGQEALHYLKAHADDIQLVLSDINMPGMSGLELLRHIKQDPSSAPAPKVMMISAYADEENYQRGKATGGRCVSDQAAGFCLAQRKTPAGQLFTNIGLQKDVLRGGAVHHSRGRLGRAFIAT